MRLPNLFHRRPTAPIAHERLKILLTHEKVVQRHSDLREILSKEILVLVTKYAPVESATSRFGWNVARASRRSKSMSRFHIRHFLAG
jgi:septum formation topological specificity factor MinE